MTPRPLIFDPENYPEDKLKQDALRQYHRIFDLLSSIGGANENLREEFVHALSEGCEEFRFIGNLGFGGKYRHNAQTKVTFYHEDATPERKAIAKRLNEELAKL